MQNNTDQERQSFDLSGNEKKKGKKGGLFILIIAIIVIAAAAIFAVIAIRGNSAETAEPELKVDAALEKTIKGDTTLEQLQSTEVQAERERLERERKLQERKTQDEEKAALAEQEKEAKSKRFKEKTQDKAMVGDGESESKGKGGKKQLTPEDRKRSGNILVQLPKNKGGGEEGTAKSTGTAGTVDIDDGLSTTSYADGSVSFLSQERRKFLLKRFTKLRCTLYSEIITDHPGPIECYLTKDVYSSDGKILLARAGAQLIGERKVALAAGQASIFTNWRELELANGVRAQLNSLGTGPLGAVGTEAWIDNHYAERFGSAILLSLFDDTLATIQDMASDSDSSVTYDNSSDTASTIAETALKQSINIAPTGHINAGTVINVLVVRDVDFAPVYQVR